MMSHLNFYFDNLNPISKKIWPLLWTTTGEEGGGKLAILRLLSISANSRLDYSAAAGSSGAVLAKIKF